MNRVDVLMQRDVRDQITGSLGFGISAPLQNLGLPENTLAVPFDANATINLDYSQIDVQYTLTTSACNAPPPDDAMYGTGGQLSLRSPPVLEDQTYRVCAYKAGQAPVALRHRVRVRVGLDAELSGRVLLHAATGTRLLETSVDQPVVDEAARLTPFGTRVQVQVDDAQEGVEYTLETESTTSEESPTVVSQEPVGGLGPDRSITINSVPLTDDVVLRVRARRGLAGDEHTLLRLRLPVKVMANPETTMAFKGGAVVDFTARARLEILDSQANTHYRVYSRAIPDRDYRAARRGDASVTSVVVEEGRSVEVAVPAPVLDWAIPTGFTLVDEATSRTSGPLMIALPAATADQVLLVEAVKTHQREDGPPVSSSIRLAAPLILLVRPNPAPEIELALNLATGSVSVGKGEPGVAYRLRTTPEGKEFSGRAYIHQRDPSDTSRNKGIGNSLEGGLEVGIDFVVTSSARRDAEHRTTQAPPAPTIDTVGVDEAGTLYVRAIKVQTEIDVPLTAHALVPGTALITATSADVASGARASIVVTASDALDRYQLERNGQAIGEPRDGDGTDLMFEIPTLEASNEFIMRVTRRNAEGLSLARLVPVSISVSG